MRPLNQHAIVDNAIARIIATAVTLIASTPLGAGAQQYTVVDLGTLGGTVSYANGIAADGTIAGAATLSSSVLHAALWSGGAFMDMGQPSAYIVSRAAAVNLAGQVAATGEGSPQSYGAYRWESGVWTPLGVLPGRAESIAEDIDGDGRVVGRSFTLGAGDGGGFLWDNGVMTDLGTLGGTTDAYAINEAVQIVGRSQINLPEGGMQHRAFIWEDSVMTALEPLSGEDHSIASDINDAGDVVGASWHVSIPSFLDVDRATLWQNGGAIIDLGRTPGPDRCAIGYPTFTANIARALNNNGQVVGDAMCVGAGAPQAAFLWDGGVMHNLNDLIPAESGWDLLSAHDITDAGEIVGIGINPDGELHGWRLAPLPTAVRPPAGVLALAVTPNPLADATRLTYTLAEPTRVRVVVYDVAGRAVATLIDDLQGAGPHTLTWTARDSGGTALPSGVYFARLDTPTGTPVTRKIVVVR
jgi:probable HAF family extracellular repeat protein